jgi:hypothetical protein
MQGIKTGVLGLALSTFIGNALAEEICARAPDITAMQAAAVQQELMVAAFSCNDFGLYNSFVITYQKALQDSDRALQDFFLRLNADTGAADYHSFKTKLANSYSLRSSDNSVAYCGNTLRVFRAALNEGPKSLAEFVLAQPVPFTANYDACGERIPGGATIARAAGPAVAATPILAEAPIMPEAPPSAAPVQRNAEIISPPQPDQKNLPAQNDNVYSARDTGRYAEPPPQQQPQPRVRRYDARDAYARPPPSDSYGYSNRYGERDPYYRRAYERWYEYYYGRR